MFVHIIWTAVLYLLITIFRAPKVWGIGTNSDRASLFTILEPRTSANLSNQFEWPVFFYAICIILIIHPTSVSSNYIWLAWIFVIGRVLHSIVQILTDDIRIRGIVFTINFLAVLVMWISLFVDATFG